MLDAPSASLKRCTDQEMSTSRSRARFISPFVTGLWCDVQVFLMPNLGQVGNTGPFLSADLAVGKELAQSQGIIETVSCLLDAVYLGLLVKTIVKNTCF